MNLDPNELRAIIRESGVSYKETTRSFVFQCPRCGKADKLYMLKTDGRFICWVCANDTNFKGRAEYALTELVGISIRDLRKRLYGLDLPAGQTFLALDTSDWFDTDENADEIVGEVYLPMQRVEWPVDFYPIDHDFAVKGRAYLAARGIDVALAMAYGLRYCPPQRRVAFPVTHDGKLVGWQARYIGATDWWDDDLGKMIRIPKILSSESLAEKRDRVVMFSDRLTGSAHAVLCEGPVDAIKAHLCGGNVATMGKVVHRNQIELIRNAGINKIYLALDPDAASETARLVRDLGTEVECYLILPPPGRSDLGEATPEEVYEAMRLASRVTSGHVFIFLAH
jgi:hypothetical protein